ncbi:MAG TPA: hypothetical protein G4N98_02190 [Thermoflexia bacterium]|nr:hypothetical protein [Thermoflexia bacterium]
MNQEPIYPEPIPMLEPEPIPTPEPTYAPAPEAMPYTNETSAASTYSAMPSNTAVSDGKSNKTLIIAIVVAILLILCCCCAGGAFFWSNGDKIVDELSLNSGYWLTLI